MKKLYLVLAALSLWLNVAQALPIQITKDEALKWTPVTTMPKGAEVAILMGDPSKKGPFVARIKLPANYQAPVHSHPVNEYDTVLAGTWYLGMGETIKAEETVPLPVGTFVVIPAKTKHYGLTKEETIIQINGIGPWGMIYPKKA